MDPELLYYIDQDGLIEGPYDFETILLLWKRGKLKAGARIQAGTAGSWIELSALVPALRKLGGSPFLISATICRWLGLLIMLGTLALAPFFGFSALALGVGAILFWGAVATKRKF